MATLTTQTIARPLTASAGTTLAPVALTYAGDAMACGANMMLMVVSTAAATSNTVTLNVPAARIWESGVAISSVNCSVQAGQTRFIGPVDAITFADPTTGLCSITYSQGTATVAAVQLVQP